MTYLVGTVLISVAVIGPLDQAFADVHAPTMRSNTWVVWLLPWEVLHGLRTPAGDAVDPLISTSRARADLTCESGSARLAEGSS